MRVMIYWQFLLNYIRRAEGSVQNDSWVIGVIPETRGIISPGDPDAE